MQNNIIKEEQCGYRLIHQDRIDNARKTALPEEKSKRLALLFRALGDHTKLKLLWALNYEEMCVCDLAIFLGISESAVSHQLRILRQLDLVVNRREGSVLYYTLKNDSIRKLIHLALR